MSVQKALILWTMDPAERDANLVHEAVKKKDENYILVLIEVSCASTPDHLMAVRDIYRKLFSCSIEEDVASSPALQEPLKKVNSSEVLYFHQKFRKGLGFEQHCSLLQMLVSLVSSYRYAGEHVDMDVAKLEAAQLSEAIREKQLQRDEVVRIIGTRSKSQLRATFQQYKEDHGTDIGEVRSDY